MISRKTIDEIFSTARVEEVIGEFISLKKSGSNFKGLSPFSNEKTPSFIVSPAKQIWKDFSSGKGGTVVSFLMEHEQYTYPEALTWLARRYQIEIEEDGEADPEQLKKTKEKETLFLISKKAQDFFRQQLLETQEGKNIGGAYFREREISKESIDEFGLGYSPEQWDALAQHLLAQGYNFVQLEAAGLVVGNENRPIDRFRDRVIFPIHSFSGRILGFAGRILNSNKKTAKYLNSPETEIYHKSEILYGIYQAKQEIIRKNQCILVEGYTDVISLHQKGVKNVVASSGTALTPEQIRLIKRLTKNIILIYDGDNAGVKATQRSVDLILEQDLDVRIVNLPAEYDPDSFAKEYEGEEITNYIEENSLSFLDYQLKPYQNKNLSIGEQSAMIDKSVSSISLIASELKQELLIREMASITGLSEDILFRSLAKARIETHRKTFQSAHKNKLEENELKSKQHAINPYFIVEEEIIKTILSFGQETITFEIEEEGEVKILESKVQDEIIEQLREDDISFEHQHYKGILENIIAFLSKGENLVQSLLFDEESEMQSIVSQMILEPYQLSNWKKMGMVIPGKRENLKSHVENLILNYKKLVLQERINLSQEDLKNEELTPLEQQKVLEKIIFYNQILRQINIKLGRAV
ncbi:DNA primase [Candidatus Ornithobacterium hominis]|uniref:DNA primase n=1 Tax=Candidatus Ornithobacterium hominis TaxID=2497989 RepID=A0A383TX89_9FLAO|nr:DNA primase [Candidatus Ornithobacterium hominis]MCT7904197.1 DNA primase [Candidatus Ornithobacterium hominis]SZD72262.1 DNA primase [Candidatus Ornithobacterium hominis]